MTATLIFDCVFMLGVYLMVERHIVLHHSVASSDSLHRDSKVAARFGEEWFTFHSIASGLCIQIGLHPKT